MIKIPISTFASTVFLSSGYAAAAGTVAPGDSAEAAIAKLDGNQQAIIDSTLAIGPASIAQNTATTVDSVLVDDFQAVLWEVVAHDVGTPANVQILQINGFHNGHAAADATSAKDDVIQKKKIGGNFNLQTSVTISGSGGAQVMNLILETSDSDGIRYSVRRIASVPAL